MKSYDAIVTREGRWWMIEIPELDGLTQARRLDEVEKMAREYIAVTLDLPMSQVAVSVSGIEVAGQDVLETKAIVDDLRRHAQELEELVADLTREFASALSGASVPVRDVSKVLGVSHQRVSQLVQAAAKTQTSTLARLMLTAKADHGIDLVVHLKPGKGPQIVQLKSAKKAVGSKTEPVKKAVSSKKARPKRPRVQVADRASSPRNTASAGGDGKAKRSGIAGRSAAKKAAARAS